MSREKQGQSSNEHGKRSVSAGGKKYGPLVSGRNKAFDMASDRTSKKLDR